MFILEYGDKVHKCTQKPKLINNNEIVGEGLTDVMHYDSISEETTVIEENQPFKYSGITDLSAFKLTDESGQVADFAMLAVEISEETAVLYGAMDEMFNMLVDTMEANAMLMMEVEALKADKEAK